MYTVFFDFDYKQKQINFIYLYGFLQNHLLKLLKESKGAKQTVLALSVKCYKTGTLEDHILEVKEYLDNSILPKLIKESSFKQVRFTKSNALV